MAQYIAPRHFLFLLLLCFVVISFLVSLQNSIIDSLINNYYMASALLFFCLVGLMLIWQALSLIFKRHGCASSYVYASIVMFPMLLLSLWRPPQAGFIPWLPLIIVIGTQISFFLILTRERSLCAISPMRLKISIAVISCIYILAFGYIGLQKYNSFSFFNPKDFAIYNQVFYNSIHGRLFINSAYGSNFACHNSPFYLLLLPIYYLAPHPLTLIFAKIILLGLSVIPFYLIARQSIDDTSALFMCIGLLFYPYLVCQNLTAPHEATYAPFFILFCYYFFRQKRIIPFIAFLLIILSIKETFALTAIFFGIYAYLSKRPKPWVFLPIALGIIWGAISLWVIIYFQKIYQSHTDAAWFLVYMKRLASPVVSSATCIGSISSTNITNPQSIRSALLLIMPLGAVVPLLSPVWLLGLPELVLSLLADRPAMLLPPWHYNITLSCFLLIAASEGIAKITRNRKLGIRPETLRLLLTSLIIASTAIHSYTWLDLIFYRHHPVYNNTLRQAISIIPNDAFVTAPKKIAPQVSSRRDYSLLEEGSLGDYIIIDKENSSLLPGKDTTGYARIFDKNGIRVLRRI